MVQARPAREGVVVQAPRVREGVAVRAPRVRVGVVVRAPRVLGVPVAPGAARAPVLAAQGACGAGSLRRGSRCWICARWDRRVSRCLRGHRLLGRVVLRLESTCYLVLECLVIGRIRRFIQNGIRRGPRSRIARRRARILFLLRLGRYIAGTESGRHLDAGSL